MSKSVEDKKQFLDNFQQRVILGRKLLNSGNHKWADIIFTDLYFQIEKSEWMDIQKKHQLSMIISNSWWMYINSLTRKDEEGGIHLDIIRYVDAYKRFFSYLAKLDNFYQFNNFFTSLLKKFMSMEELSTSGLTAFINSFSYRVKEREDYLKLTELQIVLTHLRKSVVPSELFHLCFEGLGNILTQLEPGKRTLFLYVFLDTINIKYELMEDSQAFINDITRILVNRIPTHLKDYFGKLTRMEINERNFQTVLEDLEDLVYYLNNIGGYEWIVMIIRDIFTIIQRFQSFGDSIGYIRRFIDLSLSRNRFEIAFEIYDFLEDLFMYQTDLGYDNVLIELWVEACKKFVDMKEKRYLLQSLEKLNSHLKLPQKNPQIFHYFYTCNILWQFKSRFFSLESRDFWRMMFYRALFEEGDIELAQKIVFFLDKNLKPLLTDLNSLASLGETLKSQIYSFETKSDVPEICNDSFTIKQMILRINSEGEISFRMISLDNRIADGKITNEYWNDAQILEIYEDIFSESQDKIFNFSLKEFGRLLFLFLPKVIREFFKGFKIPSLNLIPQVYLILDNMTIPFELIYEKNYFLLKYSSAYKIGEAPLGGVAFDESIQEELLTAPPQDYYNILICDAINSSGPLKWNEKRQNKDLIFPFPDGAEELNYITNFFNGRNEVNQINLLSGPNSTRENILLNLTQGAYHIIHFVGNVFYSKWSPKDSFFLTNDNNIVTFSEIKDAMDQNPAKLEPVLFFNAQIYDVDGKRLRNALQKFGEIVAHYDYDRITGIVARNNPIFNNETKGIISNFYINLFSQISQGVSILRARQQAIANKELDHMSSLAIGSYVLFGKPWKKL